MKRVRGPGIRAGVPGGQRVHAGTRGILKCVCAFTSDFLSLPAKEEEGDLAVYFYVLCGSCMLGAVEGSALSVSWME